MHKNITRDRVALIILRIGVGSAFIYPAVDSFLHPSAWIGYFPNFLRDATGDSTILIVWAVIELIVGIWIISGWRIFIPSLAAVVSLLGIVVFNLSQIQVIFRDIALLAPALVLALSSIKRRHIRLEENDDRSQAQQHS